MATRKKATPQQQISIPGVVQSIRVKDFFNTAVKSFSVSDCVRSIPGIDGLKPSQRKALYGALTRGESAPEMQVERLSAHIAAETDYHHGTVSMAGTIVNMAVVKIPGSNNMNLMAPKGQFGSRLSKDAGAGRYIFSTLSPYFRALFRKDDDAILEHHYVDGDKIEPKFFLPILPLVLINGASGTGTGHSCEIKSYHPNHIRDACVKVLDGKTLKKDGLTPWFRGFNGTVERIPETGQVVTTGKMEIVNTTTIIISELPIGKFVDDYKTILNKLEDEGFIKDYDDNSSEESFKFTITCPRSTTALDHDTLMAKFKLIGRDTENFTLWTPEGDLVRLESPEEIVEMYVDWRVQFYETRRVTLIEQTEEQIRYNQELIRFIKFFQANTKMFKDTPKAQLIEKLLENNFVDYDRLLGMAIWSLTKDRIDDLVTKLENLMSTLKELKADTANDMYRRELLAFKYTASDETINYSAK